jgi:hypothetical protein
MPAWSPGQVSAPSPLLAWGSPLRVTWPVALPRRPMPARGLQAQGTLAPPGAWELPAERADAQYSVPDEVSLRRQV